MNIVCRVCRSWILQRRIQARLPELERVIFAWGHDAVLASDLAAMAGRVCATDLSLFRADADLRVALYRLALAGYRQYQRDYCELLNFAPDEKLSASCKPMVRKVRQALRQLDERQRLIVSLVDLGGCSYAEVGQILVLSRSELLVALCNARAQLKMLLLGHPASAQMGQSSRWGAR